MLLDDLSIFKAGRDRSGPTKPKTRAPLSIGHARRSGTSLKLLETMFATSNKCIASSNKCLTSSNKDATRNKKTDVGRATSSV